MNLNNTFLLIMVLFLTSCGSSSDGAYEPSSSYDSGNTYSDATADYAEDSAGERVKPDGDYDCSATNISRGNGPYSLGCEKDGGDVTIHFNNGGHITVDEDGYDPNSGEHWDVELE